MPKRNPLRGHVSIGLLAAGGIEVFVGSVGMITQSQAQQLLPEAQQLLPDSHIEVADQDRFSWNVRKVPPQPFMNEVYWQYSAETPAFFRDSYLQFVARTFDFTSGNFNGSKSQAWAAGGWLAFRSGLIGDVFGVHAAAYTSQPIFAPFDEGGTKLLAPVQIRSVCLGRYMAARRLGTRNFEVVAR
jgi:hypothetical protein